MSAKKSNFPSIPANLPAKRQEPNWSATLFPPRGLLLVGIFAVYLCWVVDLRLVFTARDRLFLWNSRFLTDFLGHPGALLDWVDGLLVQACYNGWPATLVLTFTAWLMMAGASRFMNAAPRHRVDGTWLLPVIALFWWFGDYHASTVVLTGAALTLLAANVWVRIPCERLVWSLAGFLALSLGAYYVGGEVYYCFAACCLVHAALARRSWRLTLGLLLAGVAAKIGLDAALAWLHPGTRYFHALPVRGVSLNLRAWLFLGYFPLCAAWASFRRESNNATWNWAKHLRPFPGPREAKTAHAVKTRKSKPLAESSHAPGAWANRLPCMAGTGAMLLAAGIVGFCSVRRDLKSDLEIGYCADHVLWSELLAKARRLSVYSPCTCHNVNLALYHTGRLPLELFSYPQPKDALGIIFVKSQVPYDALDLLREPCDFMLELGRVNEAEQMALEMLENCPSGGAFQRMARIKMIKAQPDAARLFLTILCDDLIWGRWAEGCLARLRSQPDLAGDEEVQRIRRLMLLTDDMAQACTIGLNEDHHLDFATILLDLCKHNPHNQMACEYLLALNLLRCDLRMVTDLMPLTTNFTYSTLPPCYEEAELLYGAGHPEDLTVNSSGVLFRGHPISNSTLVNFRRFKELANRTGVSPESVAQDIARELPGSYLAYYSWARYYSLARQKKAT